MKNLNHKYIFIVLIVIFFIGVNAVAQVGIGTTTPNANAMLDVDVSSLATDAKKGFMPPRMTTSEKNTLGTSLVLSDKGMLVFDTDLTAYYYWNGTTWLLIRIDSVVTDSDSFGNMYLTVPDYTVIASKNTPLKIEGVTTAENLNNFVASGNNRLVYTGSKTRIFSIVCSMSFGASSKNDHYSFYIYHGGNASPGIIQSTKVRRFIAATSDIGALSVSGLVSLAPNEWIEVWGECTDEDDQDLNVETFNLMIY
ncbi:MAG: hypothetical protein QM495_08730 [Lutibacter sp.]|uniref:hypothetical protein n=1 Tax=Lutibacter sp. TaxID=1925666 RepID=UPI00385BB5C5